MWYLFNLLNTTAPLVSDCYSTTVNADHIYLGRDFRYICCIIVCLISQVTKTISCLKDQKINRKRNSWDFFVLNLKEYSSIEERGIKKEEWAELEKKKGEIG